MEELCEKERASVIEVFILEGKSATRAFRKLATGFYIAVNRKKIYRIYQQFKEKNCFAIDHLKRRKSVAGAPKSISTPENRGMFAVSVLNSPIKSIPRRTAELGISNTTIRRI
jgi:hypothetical protein